MSAGDGLNRANNGKFAKGNSGGPGRPRRAVEADYLRALTDVCPPGVWHEIVAKAVDDARSGDARAREWLAGYLVGRADQKADDLLSLAMRELDQFDPIAAALKSRAEAARSNEKLDELIISLQR